MADDTPTPAPRPAPKTQLRCAYPGDRLRLADGTEVTGAFAEFSADQAKTVRDAARKAGVTLIEK